MGKVSSDRYYQTSRSGKITVIIIIVVIILPFYVLFLQIGEKGSSFFENGFYLYRPSM